MKQNIEAAQDSALIRSTHPGINILWIEQNRVLARQRFEDFCHRLRREGQNFQYRPISLRILLGNDTVIRFSHVESGDELRGEMCHEVFVYSTFDFNCDFYKYILHPMLQLSGGFLQRVHELSESED